MLDDADITVFIPVRNGARYLGETLDSIAVQTYGGFKVVILENGSTDNSVEIAKKERGFPIKIRPAKTVLDMAGNFNRALETVDTDFFALMHADDTYRPDYLGAMRSMMQASPDSLAGYCNVATIDGNAFPLDDIKYRLKNEYDASNMTNSDQLAALSSANIICAPAIFYRREVSQRVGTFRPMKFNLDWDYSIRLLLTGSRFVKHTKTLLNYRIHAAQLTQIYVDDATKYQERIAFLSDHANDINARLPLEKSLTQARILRETFQILLWDSRCDFKSENSQSITKKMEFLQNFDCKTARKYRYLAQLIYKLGPAGQHLLEFAAQAAFIYRRRQLRRSRIAPTHIAELQ